MKKLIVAFALILAAVLPRMSLADEPTLVLAETVGTQVRRGSADCTPEPTVQLFVGSTFVRDAVKGTDFDFVYDCDYANGSGSLRAVGKGVDCAGLEVSTTFEIVNVPQTAEKGVAQMKFANEGFNEKTDPLYGGEVVGGALLASVTGTSATWGGVTYTISGVMTWAYRGFIYLSSATNYWFAKCYDDTASIRIWSPDFSSSKLVLTDSSWSGQVYGSYQPTASGWHMIDLRICNVSGGVGIPSSATQFMTRGGGLLWNDQGLETCTADNCMQWRLFMNTDEETILYTADPSEVTLMVSDIPDQIYDGQTPCTPHPESVSAWRAGKKIADLVENIDYKLSWSDNDHLGTGRCTLTGLGDYAGVTNVRTFVVRSLEVFYVAESAVGAGDGSCWTNATTWTNAMAVLAQRVSAAAVELWLKTGTYTNGVTASLTAPLRIRGGFAGTETNLSDRVPGARTHFDGLKKDNLLTLASSAAVTLDGLSLDHAYWYGLRYTGAGNLTLVNCDFVENCWIPAYNGVFDSYGLGADLNGSGALVVSNCTFVANRARNGAHQMRVYGAGLGIRSFASATLDSCLFVSNGVNFTNDDSGRAGTWGAALHASNVPLDCRRCRFVGNANHVGSGGGIVRLADNCSGSSFRNCLFACNGCNGSSVNAANATLRIDADAAVRDVTVDGCTFAYNVYASKSSSSGIHVSSGSLTLRNSVFWKNVRHTDATVGADVHVAAGSSLDAAYNSFPVDSPASFTCSGTLVRNVGAIYGDPLFATPFSSIAPLIDASVVDEAVPMISKDVSFKTAADVLGVDCHLHSRKGRWSGADWVVDEDDSPCLDMGDPAASYDLEPDPNGDRLNLGCYGNTSEASLSPNGRATVDSVTVDQTVDYSQPFVTCTLGGEDPYSARVIICTGLSSGTSGATNGWANVYEVAAHKSSGETLTFGFGDYFSRNDLVSWQLLVVTAGGTTTYTPDGALTITQDKPPYYGKGGGAGVIHVWPGRHGKATGENWCDAVETLNGALAIFRADAAKSEIWIAGTNVTAAASEQPRALAIRGGFAGGEESAEARSPGARSLLDGGKTQEPLTLSSSADLTIERLTVVRAYRHGLVRSGSGALTVVDCDFLENGWRENPSAVGPVEAGIGAQMAGSGALVVSNCTFCGNLSKNGSHAETVMGAGLHISGFAQATVESCLFLTNGVALGDGTSARQSFTGAAAYVNGVPTLFRNVRFLGNVAQTRDGGVPIGAIVYLTGAAGGTAFSNCCFLANGSSITTGTYPLKINAALSVELSAAAAEVEVANCTFAWNMMPNRYGASGIEMTKGALKLRNSIFWSNSKVSSGTLGADLHVESTASADVAWCLFGTNTADSVSSDGTLAVTNCVYGDPLFVTQRADWESQINGTLSKDVVPVIDDKKSWKGTFSPLSFNCHLRGKRGYTDEFDGQIHQDRTVKTNIAVDAGDPTSDYSKEPAGFNGKRVNLGFYGNTPYATRSASVGFLLMIR